jgi:hypothetical protein
MRCFTAAIECQIGLCGRVVMNTKRIPAEVAVPRFHNGKDGACCDGCIHAGSTAGQNLQGCGDGKGLACGNPSPPCDNNAAVCLHGLLG